MTAKEVLVWNWELQLATDLLTAEETAILAETVQRARREIANAKVDTDDTGKAAHVDTVTVSCQHMLAGSMEARSSRSRAVSSARCKTSTRFV